MSVTIAHATHDERGQYHGGKAGDQGNVEIVFRTWYNRPWTHVIRFKEPSRREIVAKSMEAIVNNNNIGYDQWERTTMHIEAKKVGWDFSKITRPCETDCSAAGADSCIAAGVPESALYANGKLAYTGDFVQRIKPTGMVDIFTSADYIKSDSKLIRGDILLNDAHHMAVVINSTNKVQPVITPAPVVTPTPTQPQPVESSHDDIARQVIKGTWGNGNDRRIRLTNAGYNYAEIQSRVNAILNGTTLEGVARMVINGKFGNGNTRKTKLKQAGYDYDAVQAIVNKLI